ncbi:MAG: hypothetical protein ACREGJ_04620 [Candidatus Saccharimonadales bacterium]
MNTPEQSRKFGQGFVYRTHGEHLFDTYGGEVKVRVTHPSLHEIKDPTPIAIANGWATNSKLMENAADVFARQGRYVITFDNPRSNAPIDPMQRKVMTLRAVVNYIASPTDRIDVITLSEGIIPTVLYAEELHKRGLLSSLRSITAINPAGVSGRERPLRLAGKMGYEILRTPLHDSVVKMARTAVASAGYTTSNISLSIREVLGIAGSDMAATLLHLQDAGVAIGVGTSRSDVVCRPEQVKSQCAGLALVREFDGPHSGFMHSDERAERTYEFHQEVVALAIGGLGKARHAGLR